MNSNLILLSMVVAAIACVGGLQVTENFMDKAAQVHIQQRRQDAYTQCVRQKIAEMDAQWAATGDVFGRVPIYMLDAVANSLAQAKQSKIAEIQAYCGQN